MINKTYIYELIIDKLISTDFSYTKIASLLSCSPSYVHKVAIKNNLQRKNKKQQIKELLQDEPNMSYTKISELTGYSNKNISHIANNLCCARHTNRLNHKYYEVLEDIKEYKGRNLVTTLSRKHNVSRNYIYHIINETNINKKE